MEIGVSVPIFTHKTTKGSMVKRYPYSTKWDFFVFHNIYEARAIIIIFCDHQDTES